MLKQLNLAFPSARHHGGVRKGAGRKRAGPRNRVSHRGRVRFHRSKALHVTCRISGGLPSLRNNKTAQVLIAYLAKRCIKKGFRIVEYSIQGNHLHLICEATNSDSLSRAMNGLQGGLARILNRHWGRCGKVFEDRYHVELIETPTQCRNALRYILHNAKKHRALPTHAKLDPLSTAPWFRFTGQSSASPRPNRPSKPAAHPRGWLLQEGWRRSGPLYLDDSPLIPSHPLSNPKTP